MNKAWQQIDLEGGGLQTVNQRLSRALRRRSAAYLLWLAFPLGAHRLYLASRGGAALYGAATTLAILLWLTAGPRWVLLPAAGEILFALFDLIWIDRRIVALNKAIRMKVYLGGGAEAPANFRGRYTDDTGLDEYLREKESERGGVQPADMTAGARAHRRAPSFAEQEAMLRELSKRREHRD